MTMEYVRRTERTRHSSIIRKNPSIQCEVQPKVSFMGIVDALDAWAP